MTPLQAKAFEALAAWRDNDDRFVHLVVLLGLRCGIEPGEVIRNIERLANGET